MPEHGTLDLSRRRVLQGAAAGTAALFGAGVVDRRDTPTPTLPVLGTYDVVVVGCGAAGMTAALTAAARGLSVVVVEKAPTFGGSAARSGAGIWIPNNPVILAAGVPDTPAKAAAVPGRRGRRRTRPRPGSTPSWPTGPAMLSFVMAQQPAALQWMDGYSDYYPELPGGMPGGRSIEPDLIDGNILGAELANLNPAYLPVPGGPGGVQRGLQVAQPGRRQRQGHRRRRRVPARAGTAAALAGQKPLTMGQSLAAGLRAGLLRRGVAGAG